MRRIDSSQQEGVGGVCVETLQRFLQTGSARLLVLREGRSSPGEAPPPPPPCSPFTPVSRLVSTSRLPHPHPHTLALHQLRAQIINICCPSCKPHSFFHPFFAPLFSLSFSHLCLFPANSLPGDVAQSFSGGFLPSRPRCLFR